MPVTNDSKSPLCGYLVGHNGWWATDDKTKALGDFPKSLNRTDLRSFLGVVLQFSAFSSKTTEFAKPLHDPLKAKNEFVWDRHTTQLSKQCERNWFNLILKFYDPSKPTRLETDGSRKKNIG